MAKMLIIENGFNKNSQNTPVSGYINDQNNRKWEDWDFGLTTMKNAGCGVISIYNFLYSTGTQVDLATLIALVQYSNADLLLGYFGTNPIPEDLMFIGSNLIFTLFNIIAYPIIIEIVIPVVAGLIVALEIGLLSWFYQIFLWPNYPALVLGVSSVLQIAFSVAIFSIETFVSYYFWQLNDITDVLGLYGVNNSLTSYWPLNDFTSFEQGAALQSKYIILTFFNELSSDGNINIEKGIHTIFIYYDPITNKYYGYNNGYGVEIHSDLWQFMSYYNTYSKNDSKKLFVSGIAVIQ
ncbi:MAG: hypothetical protein LBV58_05125 [Acholeplasmatales bacterium]|jgi:hypothetical protein|nr:hypothetical protein [Acholeplasmatales bacterium]